MNTFQIYEEFKGFLGEPAAKSLAHTLGTMFEELRNAVTKEDFRILRDSMDANVARLDTALGRLAEAQERTEGKVGELAAGQERLTLAQARTESKVSELAEAQARTESKVSELAEAQRQSSQSYRRMWLSPCSGSRSARMPSSAGRSSCSFGIDSRRIWAGFCGVAG